MKKYPSIEQFRNIVHKVKTQHDFQGLDEEGNAIYAHTSNYPTLTFEGTVKLHGTNAAIVRYADGRTEFQSRERVLSEGSDNAGFYAEMSQKNIDFLFSKIPFNEYVAIYGEWCGANIQKGVGITGLPKMFVIFGIKIDGEWGNINQLYDPEQKIYNIRLFDRFSIDIDFNHPELSQNKLIEMTLQVEDECPVAKAFGVSGVGEGIVFTCTTNPELKFKSKGEKHSVSKVKTLNSIDVEEVSRVEDFVENVCTVNRLEQGLSYMKEMQLEISQKSTGEFLRWVVSDVLKEEKDTIEQNNLNSKKVAAAVSNKARVWYFNNL